MELNQEFNISSLKQLFSMISSKSTTVAVNISSRSTVEIAEFDKNGLIVNYGMMPVQYNAFTKELENINEFESNLKHAFADLKIPLTAQVYLSLPTIIVGHESIPAIEYTDEDIKSMLVAVAEKNYIFKKYDPEVAFYKIPGAETDSNINICYSALRSDEYLKIKDVFTNIGLKVVAVDSTYSSLINGVIATGKVSQSVLENNVRWNIINVTSNSFMIFAMEGRNLIAIYEEPLAVKSFSEEEVYQVICTSLDTVLNNYPAEQLIVVSQSEEVSAEYMSSTLKSSAQISYIEDNTKYKKQLIEVGLNVTQSSAQRLTLETIGIAAWKNNIDGFKFNFISTVESETSSSATVEFITVPLFGKYVDLTPELIKKIAVIFFIIVAMVLGGVFAGLSSWYNVLETQQTEIGNKITTLERELKVQPNATGITEEEFLQKGYNNNVNYKLSYSAIAKEIPPMVWIEEFQLTDDSKMYLKGRSYRMEDVLNYYDSLKALGKYTNLKITVLKVSNTEISELLLNENSDMFEETTYEFVFGDMVYSDPTKAVAPTTQETTNPDGTPVAPAPTATTQNQAEQAADVPPPPTTEIPKQDK